MRWPVLPILLLGLLLLGSVACGGDSVKQRRPTPTTSAITAGGPVLPALTTGHDVHAPDGWYTLRVPMDWITTEGYIAETAARATTGDPPLSINITREALQQITQPQAYVEAARNRVNVTYQDVITISLAPVRIGDTNAYRWMYHARLNGKPRLIYQIFIVKGGTGLVLTGSAPGDADIDATRATFDAIAGSLSFGRG